MPASCGRLQVQLAALLQWVQAAGVTNPDTALGWSSVDPSVTAPWPGVDCNRDAITGIRLDGKGLSGNISNLLQNINTLKVTHTRVMVSGFRV